MSGTCRNGPRDGPGSHGACRALMTETAVLAEREGPILWITLNRPAKLNAFNDQLLRELDAIIDEDRNSDSSVVIIRGAGRAFSAGYDVGGDVAEIAPTDDMAEIRERQAGHADRCLRFWDHPKPVIAAVHGFCMAGATQMCVFCDITVVAHDAVIAASPALPLGGGFISPMWASLVGPKRAKQMSFAAGHRISGDTAVNWGWANYAVEADDLEDSVRDLALEIARTPVELLRLKKIAVNRAMDLQGFRTLALMGAETNTIAHGTEAVKALQALSRDHGLKEAIRRFNEDGAG
jgi:enoyl-CoA hydratase/carnithine racemase